MSRVLMCVLLLFLSGCASVPREEALKLGAAGQKAAEAGQAALADLAGEVGGFPERSAVLLTVATCTAPATPSPCGISQAPGDVLTADEKLAGVISLRARALSQLHSAYGVFLEEAEYDAAVDIDQSLGELADSVNNLAGAMALLSGGTSLLALPATKIARKAAGESARTAQKRRLLEASRALREIDQRLLELLREEAEVYQGISEILHTNRLQLADVLLQAGLLDPRPLVDDFLSRNRLGAAMELETSDPVVLALARTVHAHQAGRLAAASRAAYQSHISAFEALIALHEDFEAGKPLSLDDVARALGEIRLWAELLEEPDGQAAEEAP